jgi:hypothetical protein
MFPLLLFLIPLISVFVYLLSWPVKPPWPTRIGFDAAALALLVIVCLVIRSGPASNPQEAAELAHWQPYISAIYVAALSVIVLAIAGTVRHFLFRTRA